MATINTDYTYRVILIRAPGYRSSADITEFVDSIPLATDTGLYDINSAVVSLRSPNGEFLTADPIINFNDHIRIIITDNRSGSTYDREFEYAPTDNALQISESASRGTMIRLNLLGIEYHTQKVNYLKPIYKESGFEVAKNIGDSYNANKGSTQPEMYDHELNEFPKSLFNNYPYGDTPGTTKDRLLELATSFGAPPEVGGVQDFFTVGFNTDIIRHNRIRLLIKKLGSTPENPITITEGTLSVDEDDRNTTFSPAEANRIIGLFDSKSGSLPVDSSRFEGKKLRYLFLPNFSTTVSYVAGEEIVNPVAGRFADVWRCIRDVGPRNGITRRNWLRVPYSVYIGDIQYSPWTDDKSRVWLNSGTLPDITARWGRSMPDSNVAIKNDYFRISVRAVANNVSEIPSESLYPGRRLYRGLKVLVRDGTNEFDGIRSTIMQYDGSKWTRKYTVTSGIGSIVIDSCTGKSYRYESPTLGFTEYLGAETRDCLHPFDSITNVQGVLPASETSGMSTNQLSAIEVAYHISAGVNLIGSGLSNYFLNLYDMVTSTTSRETINPEFYKTGVSLALSFPFPVNTFGGLSEDVGEIYGGNVASNQEPATIDIQNSNLSHDGKQGFNNSSSNDLGQLFGIGLHMRIRETLLRTPGLLPTSNFRVRAWIRDTSDNTVIQDFDIPFNDEWTRITLPFSGFKPYRPLRPRDVTSIVIPPNAVENFDIFEWQNIQDIGFHTLSGYDAEGRYNTLNSVINVDGLNVLGGAPNAISSITTGRSTYMAIDNLRFIKRLQITSQPNEDKNQEKVINLPNVTDYSTGEYFIKAEEERLRFPKKTFVLDIRGNASISYGDSVFYRNPTVIDTTDDEPNSTIKLAIQRVEHSITSGGFRTKIFGGKRFTT